MHRPFWMKGTPTRTLVAPPGGPQACRAVGFSDVTFIGGGRHLLAAGGRAGQVRNLFIYLADCALYCVMQEIHP